LLAASQFTQHLPLYYTLFSSLILVTNPKIREVLKEIFDRVGTLHNFISTASSNNDENDDSSA
jgi:hypothetical protein